MASWAAEYPQGNIALSPPKTVLGIDVDMYDGKAGAATLAAAIEEWGELPATWKSTSRTDGSGIALFVIPEGLAWPGKLPQGGGIELIRWDHRYMVVAPSLHPEGREYVWVTPDGEVATDEFPEPSEENLPKLPESWVVGLTGGKKWSPREEADLDPAEVQQWIEDRGDHALCAAMDRTLNKHLVELRKSGGDGGAHEQMTNAVWSVVGDAQSGHRGLIKALVRLRKAFREATKDRRSEKEFASEWARSKAGAVQKVVAEGEPEDEDLCELEETAHVGRQRKRRTGSEGMDFARNDLGNAQRFAHGYRGNVCYVESLGGWHVWNYERSVWMLDLDGEIKRMAMAAIAKMSEELEFIEDTKERAAFRKFINTSSNRGKMLAMIDTAQDLKGMTVPGAKFDGDPRLLVVGNGTLELGESGARFRLSRQEDYNTLSTPVRYREGAEDGSWEKFLLRSIPNEETRDWIQRAAGYSLLGANPERLFFIIEGKTSSGKSTFVEVIREVMGPYAATFELNLFRSQKEQGPNVQLVRLLPKRFVVASEASQEQFLHADQLKRVTGGEALSGRLNRSNEMVERAPAFTPWLATNAAPTIRGADQALYRRMYTVPFDQTIAPTEEDPDLKRRLVTGEAAEAVLAWLVRGWDRYCEDGLRDAPAEVVQATLKTREELSDFDVWLNESCTQEAEAKATTEALYQSYRIWCADAEIKPESKVEFGRLLGKRGFNQRMIRTDPKDRDKKARGWTGVRVGLKRVENVT
jgi:P4 family phage/plasmid primase-like protien